MLLWMLFTVKLFMEFACSYKFLLLRSLKLFKKCFDLCLCGLKHFVNSRHSASNLQKCYSITRRFFFITYLCLYLFACYPALNSKHYFVSYVSRNNLNFLICTLQVKNDSVCDKSRQILHEKLSPSLFQISSTVHITYV